MRRSGVCSARPESYLRRFINDMLKNKIKVDVSTLLLFITLCLYLTGGFLIREEETSVQRESFVYYDSEGEEYEGEKLIEIEGIGKVLSYSDIYLSTLSFLIISAILAKVIFNNSSPEWFLIYTNCILGLLLIWLTTKSNVISTILYWCGIITASCSIKKEKIRI